MICRSLAAACVLLAFGLVVIAGEIKGRIVKVDATNRKITLKVDDKEQEFTLGKDTKILGPKGDLKDGLKHKVFQNENNLKKGIKATITTEKKDDAEVVTEVKLTGGKKKSAQTNP
ncbi:MAG TPA: hypothetical protein VKE94_01350 [Gemmataceae bacterium]|nr:hypothetical protein [Gemmataceae bacterium]